MLVKGKWCHWASHVFCQEDSCDNCYLNPICWIDWIDLHNRCDKPVINPEENRN